MHLITMITMKQLPFLKNCEAIYERDHTEILMIDPAMLELLQEIITVLVSLMTQHLVL